MGFHNHRGRGKHFIIMVKKPPIHINQILKLTVNRFGKEGNPIFVYKNFIIFLKTKDQPSIHLNEFMKIRIIKVLPNFAFAELIK